MIFLRWIYVYDCVGMKHEAEDDYFGPNFVGNSKQNEEF
jgi:hypothetical protein